MLKLLKLLFRRGDKEPASGGETKKCLNCLRRVDVQKNSCPHCGHSNFVF